MYILFNVGYIVCMCALTASVNNLFHVPQPGLWLIASCVCVTGMLYGIRH